MRLPQPWIHRLLARSLLLGLLASCGGGVGQDGTGASPDAQAQGVVNGFGSVIVGGVRFDVSQSAISVDGRSGASQADLRVGMVVDVTGTLAADGETGVATQLRYESLLAGTLDAAPTATELLVLGQRVLTDQATVLAGVDSVAELRAGDTIQVSGFRDTNGSLLATWVQKESGTAATPQLSGFVSAVAGTSLQVAGLEVDIATATLVGLRPGALAPGQLVRLVLQASPVAGRAVALQVRLIDLSPPAAVRVQQLQGILALWDASQLRFTLNGQAVQLDANTRFQDGSLADLATGARIEVRGVRGSDLVLKAERVRLLRPLLTAYGRGKVSSVDAAGKRFALFAAPGLEVRVRADTLLNDSSSVAGSLNLSNLAVDDELLVLGRHSGNRIDADLITRLPRLTPGSGVGGPVTRIAGNTLTVLNIDVATVGANFFDAQGQPQTQAAFFAALQPGDLVRAEGVQLGANLVAVSVRRLR
jgi:hypothetical protein